MNRIIAKNVSFKYLDEKKESQNWNDFNFEINSGEVTSILGVSGVGKTTLIKVLSGLNKPTTGEVILSDSGIIKQPGSPIFFVFQDYNSTILPWLTVRSNILLGDYKSGHTTTDEELEKIIKILFKEFLNSKEDFLKKYPSKLSGGQRQRIQIARALVSRAQFIFFDEPDSAVDIHVKLEIKNILRDLALKEKIGIVLVTHDLDNAIDLSATIYVLDKVGLHPYKTKDFIKPLDIQSYVSFKDKLLSHFNHCTA